MYDIQKAITSTTTTALTLFKVPPKSWFLSASIWHVVSSFKFSIQKNIPAPQAYSGVVATRSGFSQKVLGSEVRASDAARKL